MKTIINQKEYDFVVKGDEAALEIIREKAKLTGTKLVCGAGVCGACTVLVEGSPVCSCLLPASSLEGKKIETIEAYPPEKLHPVQKAFMACDGLQCGYCTPGFIMEGIAFYKKWRKKKGKDEPSREEIAEGLAGHLCRCGAYLGIYEAMQKACIGEFDEQEMPLYDRVDALAKVSGMAKYTTDIHLEGQLIGKILRSPYTHSKILKIDTAEAEKMLGVKALIRLNDTNEVLYAGQEILALAAVDEQTALDALEKIQIDYQRLPFVLHLEDAIKDSAPLVYPQSKKSAPNASEGPVFPSRWKGNQRTGMIPIASVSPGKARRKLKKAKDEGLPLFEAIFKNAAQSHTTLEPHGCVAKWEKDGSLLLYFSTQSCHHVAQLIAKEFNLSLDKVTIIADFIGGGFGSKAGMKPEARIAIQLAQKANAPVAVIFDRLEELSVGGYRPSTRIEMAMMTEADGSETVMALKGYINSGIGIGPSLSLTLGNSYKKMPKYVVETEVVSHKVVATPFRGPGGPNTAFALEQSIDHLANQLKIDPLEFRMKWDKDKNNEALYRWVKNQEVWKNRRTTPDTQNRFKTGLGLSFGNWPNLFVPSAIVEVEATKAGFIVRTATQDMGQGSKSVLAKAVSEVFGVSSNKIIVQIGNSHYKKGPTSGGSRTTTTVYPPAFEAAMKVRNQIVQSVSPKNKLQEVSIVDGGIKHSNGFITWEEAITQTGTVKAEAKRGRNSALDLMSYLKISKDGLALGKEIATCAYISEIEIDVLLGKIKVKNVWGAIRGGKMFVPKLAASQCYGAVIQGIGFALYEEQKLCPQTGQVLTVGMEDYRIPGLGDIPEIYIDFIEEGFEQIQHKGMGISELATAPIAASIANAIFNASGWRPLQTPILPEKVIAAFKEQNTEIFDNTKLQKAEL